MTHKERAIEYALSIGATGCFITGIILTTVGSVGLGLAGGVLILCGIARIRAHGSGRRSEYEVL